VEEWHQRHHVWLIVEACAVAERVVPSFFVHDCCYRVLHKGHWKQNAENKKGVFGSRVTPSRTPLGPQIDIYLMGNIKMKIWADYGLNSGRR
jgi:hypothetical protein